MTDKVYLDNNATTPLEPVVIDSITSALNDAWGNPSSGHSTGQVARGLIDKAREDVAQMVGGEATDIIFTSGGTEANNMVIQTALKHYWHVLTPGGSCKKRKLHGNSPDAEPLLPHVITSNVEHDSIALVLKELVQQQKADVTYVPVSHHTGAVDPQKVLKQVRPNTCLITLMLANNETGAIQNISEVVRGVRGLDREGMAPVLTHTDAAQALGKVPVDVRDLGVNYLTIVGHKFYGPRVGALYCHGLGVDTPLYPTFWGGGQERNYRPGTENTPMIVGLGKAAFLVCENVTRYGEQMKDVRDYLKRKLKAEFGDEGMQFNSDFAEGETLPNTCNVSLVGERLCGAHVLSRCRVLEASVGAACHSSQTYRVSPILQAVGIPDDVARNALRLSVGRHTTRLDVDAVVADLRNAVTAINNENS